MLLLLALLLVFHTQAMPTYQTGSYRQVALTAAGSLNMTTTLTGLTIGNHVACSLYINQALTDQEPIRVDGVFYPSPAANVAAAVNAQVQSVFFVATSTSHEISIRNTGGVLTCIEVAGADGLDTFARTGGFGQSKSKTVDVTPICGSNLVVVFSVPHGCSTCNPTVALPGTRVSTAGDRGAVNVIQGMANLTTTAVTATYQSSSVSQSFLIVLSFGACGNTAESCRPSPTYQCACGGAYCQILSNATTMDPSLPVTVGTGSHLLAHQVELSGQLTMQIDRNTVASGPLVYGVSNVRWLSGTLNRVVNPVGMSGFVSVAFSSLVSVFVNSVTYGPTTSTDSCYSVVGGSTLDTGKSYFFSILITDLCTTTTSVTTNASTTPTTAPAGAALVGGSVLFTILVVVAAVAAL